MGSEQSAACQHNSNVQGTTHRQRHRYPQYTPPPQDRTRGGGPTWPNVEDARSAGATEGLPVTSITCIVLELRRRNQSICSHMHHLSRTRILRACWTHCESEGGCMREEQGTHMPYTFWSAKPHEVITLLGQPLTHYHVILPVASLTEAQRKLDGTRQGEQA